MMSETVRKRGLLQSAEYEQPENIKDAFKMPPSRINKAPVETLKELYQTIGRQESNEESKSVRISVFAQQVLTDVQRMYDISRKEAMDMMAEFYYKQTMQFRNEQGYLDKTKIK